MQFLFPMDLLKYLSRETVLRDEIENRANPGLQVWKEPELPSSLWSPLEEFLAFFVLQPVFRKKFQELKSGIRGEGDRKHGMG